jgi:hypothetical protein
MKITWKKRAVTLPGICGPWREWHSRCGRYKVRRASTGFYALIFVELASGEAWLSVEMVRGQVRRYRRRTAAIAACERHARSIGYRAVNNTPNCGPLARPKLSRPRRGGALCAASRRDDRR